MDRLHYVVSVYTVLNASEHASTCHTNPTRTAKDALLQPRTSSGWKRHKQFCRSYSYYCSLMRCFLRIKKSFLETNRKKLFSHPTGSHCKSKTISSNKLAVCSTANKIANATNTQIASVVFSVSFFEFPCWCQHWCKILHPLLYCYSSLQIIHFSYK